MVQLKGRTNLDQHEVRNVLAKSFVKNKEDWRPVQRSFDQELQLVNFVTAALQKG
jgi:hypothetical protein